MATMTLLDIVQDILSDLDSDEVNSISDTVEATQVAQIVKTTYFNIIDGKDWPQLFQFFQLEASGTTSRPTYMRLPTNVINLIYVKYNVRTTNDTFDKFQELKYKTPVEFMRLVDARHSDASNVTVVTDATGIKFNILNDTNPTFYTSFDNEHIILDAFDSAVDSTSQTSKTQCYGKVYPTWTMEDTFIPDLPIQAFSYLLNESKSIAFVVLKQSPNPKAEQHSVTQRRRMSEEAWRLRNGVLLPDFGRKSGSQKVNNDYKRMG
jgi:hypothetical protein